MGSKREKRSKQTGNPKNKNNLKPKINKNNLKPKINKNKPKKNNLKPKINTKNNLKPTINKNKPKNIKKTEKQIEKIKSSVLPLPEQLGFFLDRLTNGAQLSSLEIESLTDTCLVELSHGLDQSADNLVEQMKTVFESSWKEMLCEKQPMEGKVEPGNPSLIVISLSALRSLEVHRALRPLTRECPAAKLFSKHMKVEEQVHFLKSRVNIACGTPSRIKKLIDIEALGLTRLKVIVLDMHTDVKGYSLLSLPQIRDEFWELYRSYFHQLLVQGDIRVCLYGPTQDSSYLKKKGC